MRSILLAALVFAPLPVRLAAQEKKSPETKTPSASELKEVGGRTAESWIKDISSKDPAKRTVAIQAIQQFPRSQALTALPALVAELKRHTAANAIDVSVRANGLHALGAILADDRDLDTKLEAEAISQITRFLKDTQVAVRFRAVHALSRIGKRARPALIELAPLLKETTAYEVRLAACHVIAQIGPDEGSAANPIVMGGLNGLVNDPSQQVRLSALQAMTVMGPSSDALQQTTIVKNLITVTQKEPDAAIKVWAHMAIMGMTNDVDDDHIVPIAKLAKTDDPLVRTQVLQALGSVGPKAKATFPTMMAALDDADPNVVGAAIWAMGRLERSAAGAVPRLELIVADAKSSDIIKKLARETLDSIQGKKK
ncbi:MAG: HEAT repeat domain-containing protein [Gemmataceae bacterium]|nr:HEAT repeat domain-containing protein [Gemmataceae bacterium]